MTLSRDSIGTLTDEQLTEALATRVMKWKRYQMPLPLFLVARVFCKTKHRDGWKVGAGFFDVALMEEFQPLRFWMDSFQIAAEAGLTFGTMSDVFLAEDPRRAICLAALLSTLP